jgi:hypothetical protein
VKEQDRQTQQKDDCEKNEDGYRNHPVGFGMSRGVILKSIIVFQRVPAKRARFGQIF